VDAVGLGARVAGLGACRGVVRGNDAGNTVAGVPLRSNVAVVVPRQRVGELDDDVGAWSSSIEGR
jgi:hypothetical protein